MPTVMIVDDDKTMSSLLETLLHLDGYEVIRAGAPVDFLARVENERPDLVLLDVFLQGGVEGYSLVRQLRAHPSEHLANLPVIMTSGMEVSTECSQAGASAFLLKPYDPEQLLQIIQANLASD